MAEEMAELLNEAREPLALEEYYLRVKGAWKLSMPELALLRELTLWREREARTSNRPRNRVLSDAILLDIVAGKANSAAALWRIEGFHSGLQRRYGEQVLAIVQSAVDTKGIERIPPPSDRDARQLLASCRALVEQKAGALKMAPELLARKKDMESLIRSHQNNATHLSGKLASGWRYPIIGEELYSHVANATV
jgi:ribonuclease D